MKIPTEAIEQQLLFSWADMATGKYPELKVMYHVPNGGSRNMLEAHNLRKQGVKRGVPDVCLPVPRGGYGALYIEMKRTKGGRLSEEQRNYIADLNRFGCKAVVCKGFEEARKAIIEYLKS